MAIEDELSEGADVEQEPEVEAEAVTPEPVDEAESPPAEDENLEEKTEPTEDRFQERLNKLTKNWRSAERAVQDREQRIAELEQKLSEQPRERAPDKSLADFDYDNEKYLEYRLERVTEQARQDSEKLVSEFQNKTVAEQAYRQFQEREVEFETQVDDYREVVNPENWACSQVMASEIHQSDVGPEMTYHLAKNPDIAMEIARAPEREAVKRMTLLETEIKAEKAKAKPKKVSTAPPPPPKIKAGDAGIDRGYYDGMSDKEFEKQRRKEIANR